MFSDFVLLDFEGDFTPVCTTELGKMAAYAEEFKKRGVKMVGLSCDDVASHLEWTKDIEAYTVSNNAHTKRLFGHIFLGL